MSTNIFKTVRNSVKNWWIPLIVGVILIGVSIYTFTSPMESYVALSMVFSISFLVIGLMEIYFAISNKNEMDNWGWTLAFGILSLAVGVIMLKDPQVSMVTLPFYVGFMIMFRSVSAIGYSYDLKSYGVLDWGNLLVVGVLGLLFSFMLLWSPEFTGMSVVIWTGLAFLFAGIYSIYFSFRLGSLHRKLKGNSNND